MKKIMIIIMVLIGVNTIKAQSIKADSINLQAEYKDYKACTDCFDNWQSSKQNAAHKMGNINVGQNNGYGKQIVSRLGRTVGAIVVGTIVAAISFLIINKTTNLTHAIPNY